MNEPAVAWPGRGSVPRRSPWWQRRRSSVDQARLLERREQILLARRNGASESLIARKLGMTTPEVVAEVRAALRELRASISLSVEEHRHLELERLDAIIATHWETKADPKSARVIAVCVKLRIDLLGLRPQPQLRATGQSVRFGQDGSVTFSKLDVALAELDAEDGLLLGADDDPIDLEHHDGGDGLADPDDLRDG